MLLLVVAVVVMVILLPPTKRSCALPLPPPVRGPSVEKLPCGGVVWLAAVQGVTRARWFAKEHGSGEMTLAFLYGWFNDNRKYRNERGLDMANLPSITSNKPDKRGVRKREKMTGG